MSDSKRILVIDDEPDFVTFITVFLEDNGYAVVSAKDGAEGIDKARSEKPDLILLDITMPEKSGVRLYRELHGDDDLKKIPVIMVTGVAIEFKKFIGSRKQVPPPDAYIQKPVDKQELLDSIAKVLAQKP
ncbi:MAG: response regulator [Planctomycetota bacterium]